jgi:hypothetical protein
MSRSNCDDDAAETVVRLEGEAGTTRALRGLRK